MKAFLLVKKGDYVIVEDQSHNNFYVGKVFNCIGSPRNPDIWTLFQVYDIDNGFIETINADCVIDILKRDP